MADPSQDMVPSASKCRAHYNASTAYTTHVQPYGNYPDLMELLKPIQTGAAFRNASYQNNTRIPCCKRLHYTAAGNKLARYHPCRSADGHLGSLSVPRLAERNLTREERNKKTEDKKTLGPKGIRKTGRHWSSEWRLATPSRKDLEGRKPPETTKTVSRQARYYIRRFHTDYKLWSTPPFPARKDVYSVSPPPFPVCSTVQPFNPFRCTLIIWPADLTL